MNMISRMGVDRAPVGERCFRHQLLLPRPYLVLTKPLRLDIQCQRGASVKIGWKYLPTVNSRCTAPPPNLPA